MGRLLTRRQLLATTGGTIAAAALAGPGATGAAAQTGPYPITDPENAQGWVLRPELSDEFNGSTIDMTKWTDEGHPCCDVWDYVPEALTVGGGTLKITASLDSEPGDPPKWYTSGMLRSRVRQLHGYFEARMKGVSVPYAVHSAFWLDNLEDLPEARTEIDIVEIQQRNPQEVSHARHIHAHPLVPDPPIHDSYRWNAPWLPNEAFHVYSMEWDADEMIWYVDGVERRRRPTQPYFTYPLEVIFNVGFRLHYRQERTPDGLPTTAEIDYVRVWEKE